MTALDVIDVGFDDGLEFFGPEGEVRPHVVSVTPSYGTSDVSNDVVFEIVFSEEAFANPFGVIVLVNTDTGQRNWINPDDTRLVQIDWQYRDHHPRPRTFNWARVIPSSGLRMCF